MSAQTVNYPQIPTYTQRTTSQVARSTTPKKSPTQPYLIGLIVFIVLGILIIILALWWFLWRDDNNVLIRACTANNQCLPNEICQTGVCNAVPCTLNSECSGVAGGDGSAYCIQGYCQTATCNNNADCAVAGGNQICTQFTPNVATPWITSACVNPGTTCSSNTDCFGGEIGLICVKAEGQATGVCSQCGTNSDCSTGQICVGGVCSECTDDADCTTGVCANGLCCADPQYMVNGSRSCVKGGLYDICVDNDDCSTGKCLDLGNNVKICGGGSQGNMTFSAGTTLNVGNPATVALYTCPMPSSSNDITATPFAVNGVCSFYSTTSAASGSACGKPSYCVNSSKSQNLLCNGNITFENPFAISCSDDKPCTQQGYGCSNAGICSQTCSNNTNCPAGYICGSNKVCEYPTKGIVCTKTNCSSVNTSNCECPSGYICSLSSGQTTGTCVWQNTGTSTDPTTPPPPFVIESICSRPATALPSNGNQIATTGYCVNGFCSPNAGWINSVCQQDGDCLFIEGNATTDVRQSFVCTDIGTYSVCRGATANTISR